MKKMRNIIIINNMKSGSNNLCNQLHKRSKLADLNIKQITRTHGNINQVSGVVKRFFSDNKCLNFGIKKSHNNSKGIILLFIVCSHFLMIRKLFGEMNNKW